MFVAQPATTRGPGEPTGTSGPLVKAGASLTAMTSIVKLCGALVSAPPFAVPPSSCSRTVTCAGPLAFGTAVNVSVPVGLIAGGAENSPALSDETMKSSDCDASLALPGPIAVAHPTAVCGPTSSMMVTSGPRLNVGA